MTQEILLIDKQKNFNFFNSQTHCKCKSILIWSGFNSKINSVFPWVSRGWLEMKSSSIFTEDPCVNMMWLGYTYVFWAATTRDTIIRINGHESLFKYFISLSVIWPHHFTSTAKTYVIPSSNFHLLLKPIHVISCFINSLFAFVFLRTNSIGILE